MQKIKPIASYFIISKFLNNLKKFIFLAIYILFIANPLFKENNSLFYYFLIFGVIICLFKAFIKYLKTYYEINNESIVENTGSLFKKDSKTIKQKDITYISKRRSFLQKIIFNSGSIKIDSYNTNGLSISIDDVNNYKDLFVLLYNSLQNDNKLKKKNSLLKKIKPDAKSGAIYHFFVLVLIFILIIISIVLINIIFNYHLQKIYALIGTIGFFMYLIFDVIYTFNKLKKTEYYIYNDCFVKKQKHLKESINVLPFENLADTELKQNIFFRIFEIFNIEFNFKGTHKDKDFKYIENAHSIKKLIDKILTTEIIYRDDKKNISNRVENDTSKQNNDKNSKEADSQIYKSNSTFFIIIKSIIFLAIGVGGYCFFNSLDIKYDLISLIVIFILSFIYFIYSILFYSNASYHMLGDKIIQRNTFPSLHEKIISYDQVSFVEFKRGFIQKILNLISIKIYSKGSSTPIKFVNIKYSKKLYLDILQRSNFKTSKNFKQMKSNSNIFSFLYINFFFIIISSIFYFLFSLIIGLFIYNDMKLDFSIYFVIILNILTLTSFYISTYNINLKSFNQYTYIFKGLLAKHYYFIKNNSIKSTETFGLFHTTNGKLKINSISKSLFLFNIRDIKNNNKKLLCHLFCKNNMTSSDIGKSYKKNLVVAFIEMIPAILVLIFTFISMSEINIPVLDYYFFFLVLLLFLVTIGKNLATSYKLKYFGISMERKFLFHITKNIPYVSIASVTKSTDFLSNLTNTEHTIIESNSTSIKCENIKKNIYLSKKLKQLAN